MEPLEVAADRTQSSALVRSRDVLIAEPSDDDLRTRGSCVGSQYQVFPLSFGSQVGLAALQVYGC